MEKGEFTRENVTSEEAIERIRNLQGGWHDLPLIGSQTTARKVKVSYWRTDDFSKQRVYIKELRGRREMEMGAIDLTTGETLKGNGADVIRALNVIPRWDED